MGSLKLIQSGPARPIRRTESTGPRGWPGRERDPSQADTRAPGMNGASFGDMHRTLPHSVEAEQAVIGSMMISPREAIAEVVGHIGNDYFYVPAHETVFNVLVAEWDRGQAIDLVTFTQRLGDMGQLEAVGGPAFVTSLFTFVPTAANLEYYVAILRDKYLLRQIIAKATAAVTSAFEEQSEVAVLVDQVEASFIGLGDDRFSETIVSVKDVTMEAIEAIEKAYENRTGVTGVATGFAELDRMTSGLQKTEMIVIAGRPSMGKTALAMNIAEHACINNKLSVGVFSLEMSRLQLVQRIICSRARINMQKVREGFLAERDFPSLTAAASRLAESRLYIDDTAGLPILELRARARRMKSKFHVELIIVDYLQLLRSSTKRAQENRQVEISEISAGLKGLAKELELPLVVVAQLNRQPEARTGGKPRLSDLRESGSIEQDADIVALLVRPEVYEDDEDAKREMAGEADLIIAKNRNGPIGEAELIFIKEFARFEDRARGDLI